MSQTNSMSAQHLGKTVIAKAKHNATSPTVQWLERFGFLIRGLIYFIIGVLALQLAVGAGGATATPTSAIALIGSQPFGKVLLVIRAVGLAGYALWGFVRALLDPLDRGSDAKGLFDRLGFFMSGLAYGALLIPTLATLQNKPAPAGGSTAGVPAGLTSGPGGKWILIAFGLFWLAAGAGQLMAAYTGHFLRDLDRGRMTNHELETATWLGKLGYAARGIVFGLIGLIILRTGFMTGSPQTPGFDGALAALAHAPYGEVLLGLVALGLILFGLYSAMCAKWTKIGA